MLGWFHKPRQQQHQQDETPAVPPAAPQAADAGAGSGAGAGAGAGAAWDDRYWALSRVLTRRSMRPVEPGVLAAETFGGQAVVKGPPRSGVQWSPVSPRDEGRGLEVMN